MRLVDSVRALDVAGAKRAPTHIFEKARYCSAMAPPGCGSTLRTSARAACSKTAHRRFRRARETRGKPRWKRFPVKKSSTAPFFLHAGQHDPGDHARQRNPGRDSRTLTQKHNAAERRRHRQESAKHACETAVHVPDACHSQPERKDACRESIPEHEVPDAQATLLHGCDEVERVTIQAGIRATSSVNMTLRVMHRAGPRQQARAGCIMVLAR